MQLSETVSSGFFFLAPWLVFAPLTGLLVIMIFGRQWGEKTVGTVASLASGAAFVVSALLAYSVFINHGEVMRWRLAEWIHVGTLNLDWTFRMDSLSTTMMLVVSGVGTLIHIYAIGYMHEDVRFKKDEGRFNRFFIFLNLFIAAMMILVSGDSYMMLFVGWEGVGLCSFLLIGFWYEMDTLGRPSWANSNAAKKAFIVNRIGDFGFLIAGFLMFWHLGNDFQFDAVFEAAKTAPPGIIIAITLFLLVGVAGKSAQIPLYVWLPDAMAGPTPVSALIHAATMVTAGVYLVTRSAPLYDLVPEAQYVVAMTGAITAFFAATIAVGQYDIKKVLAYSTISQLGFMVAAVGMGAYVGGMFHLITHAFFKALLFLSAGSVILGMERGHHHLAHAHHDKKQKGKVGKPALSKVEAKKQESHGSEEHGEVRRVEPVETFDPGDMRNMGGLRKTMPVTFWLYMVGTLALAGIFPFAGFWSKDEILLDASLHFQNIYWLLTVAAFLTAFYMGRQIWMVFFGEPRHAAAAHAEESPGVMTVPLMVLAGLSVLGGALNLPFEGFHNLGHWLAHTLGEVESLPLNLQVAGISTGLALLAIFISWLIYGRNPIKAVQVDPLKKALGPIFIGMESKWMIDEVYQAIIINPFKKLSQFLADVIDWRFWHDFVHDTVILGTYNWISEIALDRYADQKGIDTFFNNWGTVTQWASGIMRKVQNGFVRSYALSVMLGVVLILGYLIFK
ncbi:MAG TPA: NADH-quinone oxidoreductase subunit L [Anaerolineales bacterium]|nr:NADH-quinone oxidoreductase subunit L [Anaerolineales bacterium]